jgi:hypothetical protein
MVKLSEIPKEKPRLELATLPPENELKAVKEEMREAKEGKTGGLVITYVNREGKEFPQKYGSMAGAALVAALEKMNLGDTTDLQKNWYHYVMTSFRAGYPRYIPDKKVR